jgi:hypothetical protein
MEEEISAYFDKKCKFKKIRSLEKKPLNTQYLPTFKAVQESVPMNGRLELEEIFE